MLKGILKSLMKSSPQINFGTLGQLMDYIVKVGSKLLNLVGELMKKIFLKMEINSTMDLKMRSI